VTPHTQDQEELRADRVARRRMLLDHLMQHPEDREARKQLTDLVAEARRPPPPTAVGVLAVIAALCAVLSLLSLLGGMDVTATLLAVAGLYTLWIIHRRRAAGGE
jgi:hypothetical protein